MHKLTDDPKFDMRYTTSIDASYLKRWINDEEFIRWLYISNEKEKEIFLKNWLAFANYYTSLTATFDKKPIGVCAMFLYPYKKLMQHGLIYVVVAPEMRRKGIGESLIKNIKNLAKNYFQLEALHLETFVGCPVIPLLKKQQFDVVFEQKRYGFMDEQYYARTLLEVSLK